MPTYDYVCDACDHQFELFQGINEPVRRKCPACRKNRLRRLIGGGAGIIFKGSGFYATDYRSDSYKRAAEADKKTGEKKETSASDKPTSDKASGNSKPKD